MTRVTMAYVGDGTSRQHDENILSQYIADENWATYSSQLALWYDYHGAYRTYRVIDTLTNVVNNNPVEWPYITRGEAYETTIEAEEGYVISSVTVTMLDTDSTSATYDTMIDITNNVYYPLTGVISIPSVTGTVEITAVGVGE